MTYYGSKDLAAAFRTVRDNTIKIAEEIPENKYDFKPAPDCRSIGRRSRTSPSALESSRTCTRTRSAILKTVNFMEMFGDSPPRKRSPERRAR